VYHPQERKTTFTAKRVRELNGHARGFVSLSDLSDRSRSALIKAIKTGMLVTRYGDAADYLTMIREATGLPSLVTSAASGYRGFSIYNPPKHDSTGTAELVKALEDWWTADRVLFRMGSPDLYATYTAPTAGYYYQQRMAMPNWMQHLMQGDIISVIGLDPSKETKSYLPIAHALTKTQGYAEVAARARALVDSGVEIEVQLR
jgi:hypothetical protein